MCKCPDVKTDVLLHSSTDGHSADDQMTEVYLWICTKKWQGWARNLKNLSLQNKIAICKPRAQYTKRNCAFKLFKAHYAATINAKNTSFHKKF